MGYGYFPYITPDGTNPNIYDANGNLLFQFKYQSASESRQYGKITSGYGIQIHANSTDTYPYLRLLGNSGVYFYGAVASYFIIKDGATQSHKFTYSSNTSFSYGGSLTGDNRLLKANNVDTYPYIQLMGDAEITLVSKGDILFYDEGTLLGSITDEKTLKLGETTTPTAHTDAGQIYTKNDNKLYFQDGAGAEHEVAFV